MNSYIHLDTIINNIDLKQLYDEATYPKAIGSIGLMLISKYVIEDEALSSKAYSLSLEELQINISKNTCTEIGFWNTLCTYLESHEINITVDSNFPVFALSVAIYSYGKAKEIMKAADLSLSMNLEAIRGEKGAFDDRLHSIARPYESQRISAKNTLQLLDGSDFTTNPGRFAYGYDTTHRCQDSISYRAAPQTHGGARDTVDFLGRTIESLLNQPYSGTHQLRYAMNFIMIGLADMGNISERRSFRLTDEKLSYGLPTNLVYENPGINHGFPVIQAVGTAILAELKTLTLPTKLCTLKNKNAHITSISCIRVLDGLNLLSKIISVEIYMAAQAMDLVKNRLPQMKFGNGTNIAYTKLRETINVVKENRYVIPDLLESDKLVYSGILINYVESSIGKLL